jgi:sulfite dehydrogenase (cytochrome) subunit B
MRIPGGKSSISLAATLVLAALAGAAPAEEPRIELKGGAEADRVRGHCSACHSVDYIPMNSPFLKRAGWDAEVRKMIKVMGAPIPEQDVAPLVEYLTKYYGVE